VKGPEMSAFDDSCLISAVPDKDEGVVAKIGGCVQDMVESVLRAMRTRENQEPAANVQA